jgi:SPP1 family predicted phage head-tail adaptor
MKIGDLRHRIELQSYTDFMDVYGKPVRAWATYATIWAQISPISSGESINGLQLNANTTHAILVRYRTDIQPNHRIVFGDRTFNIQGVRNLDETKIATGISAQEALPMEGGMPV